MTEKTELLLSTLEALKAELNEPQVKTLADAKRVIEEFLLLATVTKQVETRNEVQIGNHRIPIDPDQYAELERQAKAEGISVDKLAARTVCEFMRRAKT